MVVFGAELERVLGVGIASRRIMVCIRGMASLFREEQLLMVLYCRDCDGWRCGSLAICSCIGILSLLPMYILKFSTGIDKRPIPVL